MNIASIGSNFFNFLKKNIVILVIGTSFNLGVSMLMFNELGTFFLFRQLFLFGVIYVYQNFCNEILLIVKDIEHVDRVLYSHHPLLKHDKTCLFLGAFLIYRSSIFLPVFCLDYELILFWIGCALTLTASFLIFFRVLIIYNNPVLKDFFNIRKSIQVHGFRSFSTVSKGMVLCYNCVGRGGLLLGSALFYPKLICMNPDARGPLNNFLAYHFSYYKLQSESDYNLRLAYLVKSMDPCYEVNRADGFVDYNRCEQFLRRKNIPIPNRNFFYTAHRHTHSFSFEELSRSFWNFFRRGDN